MECIFCNSKSEYKFKNKGICESCLIQLKMVFRSKKASVEIPQDIEDIQKTEIEKMVEEEEKIIVDKYKSKIKNTAPTILDIRPQRR